VIFDPVDAQSQFLNSPNGKRLINVALSRAKAHVIIPYHSNDLLNPTFNRLFDRTSRIWHTAGAYAKPFSFG
jgi:superfamily I DNA and/or RNA helicase